MTLRVNKKQSATLRSQSNDSLRESAITEGVREVSSPGNTNSLGEEIAADPRSPNPLAKKLVVYRRVEITKGKVQRTSLTLKKVTRFLQMKKARLLRRMKVLQMTMKKFLLQRTKILLLTLLLLLKSLRMNQMNQKRRERNVVKREKTLLYL
jgi:hypothetical protein